MSAGGNVTLHRLTLRNGNADQGGAIRSLGILMINDTAFHGNSAGNEGGAIFIGTGGTLMVNNSTFRSNVAGSGGGISNRGVLTVSSSTFGSNTATWSAGMGGAILTAGAATVNNSTFSANSAYYGGAIVNTRTATVTNSTFTGNVTGYAGAFHNNNSISAVSANVFSANSGGNCLGAFISGGYNVSSDATCPFAGRNDFTNVQTQTLAVQPNGTAPLLANSLAINNVTDPALCAEPDQLGNPRPTPCSAGAVEFITAATTRYVATTGSDASNTCLTSGAPCATLARALNQAVDGDTIRVSAGVYTVQNFQIGKSVLILGAGSGQTVLQASATTAKHSNGRVLGVDPERYVTL